MAQKPKREAKSATSERDRSATASAAQPASGRGRRRRPGELSGFQKAVIVVFIVIFGCSTLASALASVMQPSSTGTTAGEEDSTGTESTESTVESMDGRFGPIVSDLEAKVQEDPTDKASLLALGSYRFQWALSVRSLASTDDDTSHANDLFSQAIEAYDGYLALEDAPAVRVDRALCQYYEGDATAAMSALTDLTASDPDYAPAWANLGMLCEAAGDTDGAKSAYQAASEKDPDDEYGAKSYADQRLSSIDQAAQQSEGSSSADDEAGVTSSGSGSQGLVSDLSSATGGL